MKIFDSRHLSPHFFFQNQDPYVRFRLLVYCATGTAPIVSGDSGSSAICYFFLNYFLISVRKIFIYIYINLIISFS